MANNQIALLARAPEFDSPLESQGKAMQIRQMMHQGEVQDMDLQAKRQSMADDGIAREAFASNPIDSSARLAALARSPKAYAAERTALQNADKVTADIGKTKADTRNTEIDAARKAIDIIGQAMGFVFANPTLENANSTLDQLEGHRLYSPEQVASMRQMVNSNPTPENIKKLAEQGMRTATDNKDQLAKIDTRNLGNRMETRAIDPITGKATILDSQAIGQSPDSVASIAQQERNSQRVDRRAGEAAAFNRSQPRGQIIQTDQGTMLVDPRTGQAQPVMANGEALQPKLKSLPAPVQKAIGENSASLRKIESALSELEQYPDAFGLKNYLGDGIRQRTDPAGIRARALVADIGSLKVHDRSGAAVTASETPRLKPFIPSATDDPATIKKKLELFKEEYGAIQSDMVSMYSRDQGYRQAGAAPAAAGAKPTLGQIFGE